MMIFAFAIIVFFLLIGLLVVFASFAAQRQLRQQRDDRSTERRSS
jgi:hypothetical protein